MKTKLLGALAAVWACVGAPSTAAPFTMNDPLPFALSQFIIANDSEAEPGLISFLDTVTLPGGRVFDTSALVLEARAKDANATSDEGRQANGWLTRSCFDDAGGTVGCNEATNGEWFWSGLNVPTSPLAYQIAVYKSGRGYVAAVYEAAIVENQRVAYNTNGSPLAPAPRFRDDGDDMTLLHLTGKGLSHLSIYSAPVEVPLPASALLLLGAFGAAGAALRRRA